jgi:PKD repeat protein
MKASLTLLSILLALKTCSTNDTPPAPALVTAGFTLPTSAEATVAAAFQSTSQNATTYKWNFGDGGTDNTASPTHTYAKEGTYTVTLRAYGTNQDSAVTSQPLVVKPYSIFAHTTVKIPGSYKYTLFRKEHTPVVNADTRSTGTLSVTQAGTSAIAITTPETTYSLNYIYTQNPPYKFESEYVPFFVSTHSYATFYPTGDSLLFTIDTIIGLSGTIHYYYHGTRQP